MTDSPKIMIVDDDTILRDMYAERLHAEGMQVEIAANGEEALAKLEKSKPDLILLDIMMPKINGFAALEMIKSTPAYKDIKVILLTALIQSENKIRGLGAGAEDYIVKSETMPGEVVNKIKKVLGTGSETKAPAEEVK